MEIISIENKELAIESEDLTKVHYTDKDGYYHRIDGPALIGLYNIKQYYCHGIFICMEFGEDVKFYYIEDLYFDSTEEWFDNLNAEQREVAIWSGLI